MRTDMIRSLRNLLLVAVTATFAFTGSASAFKFTPAPKKGILARVIPSIGLGGALVGGTIVLGGVIVAYVELCSRSPECVAAEEEAQAAGREYAAVHQQMMACAASHSCSESSMEELTARAGRAKERQKEAKRQARLAAIAKARLNPKSGPPGFCENEKYEMLKAEVQARCKTVQFSCDGQMSKAEMMLRRSRGVMCAQARKALDFACFKGGDERHNLEANRNYKVVANCDEQIMTHFPR